MQQQMKKMVSNNTKFPSLLTQPSEFNLSEAVEWMENNWIISVYTSIVYILLIYVGQEIFMKKRQPMDLRRCLITWNFMQAAFSALVSIVIVPEFLRVLLNNGFSHSVCTHPMEFSKEAHFWGFLFLLSKMADLGDTAFIILRKRKLIFLHWYHHVTALVVGFIGAKEFVSVFAWYGALNSFVHTLMYTYYGFMSMGIQVPKLLAKTLTLTQLTQMAVALCVIGYAYYAKVVGIDCHTSFEYLHISIVVGLSYLILFANYFYMAYMAKVKRA